MDGRDLWASLPPDADAERWDGDATDDADRLRRLFAEQEGAAWSG